MYHDESWYNAPELLILEVGAVRSFVSSYGAPGDPGTGIGGEDNSYDY